MLREKPQKLECDAASYYNEEDIDSPEARRNAGLQKYGGMFVDHIAALRAYGKKTITKESLAAVLGTKSEEQLYKAVTALEAGGVLAPVKASHTNGNRIYLLYLKYKIIPKQENYDTEREEIASLHPAIQQNGFLQKNPEKYRRYRARLQKLDRGLFAFAEDALPISRKERAFQLFDEEKALQDSGFCALLERLDLGPEALAWYDTPETCFPDYIPCKKPEMTLLICENKDIWFNIRRRMFEDNAFCLFGTELDGVIYGCGNGISKRGALTDYTAFLGGVQVTYLYWGDIDRAGLSIYGSLTRSNPGIPIHLFVPAYEEMLRLARNRTIPDSEDGRERTEDYTALFGLVQPELQPVFRRAVEGKNGFRRKSSPMPD